MTDKPTMIQCLHDKSIRELKELEATSASQSNANYISSIITSSSYSLLFKHYTNLKYKIDTAK